MATTTFRETHPNIPNEQDINTRLEQIDQLKDFLANAPIDFVTIEGQPPIKRHLLPNGDSISCVQWNATHFITGTDIVRCLIFRFHAFGRPVSNLKKFEEGIFSDLRNLKPGTDATLEEPKSSFLDLLYRHNCIRTQKKQKVFFWQSVPHDRLFLDALERDLKREKLSQEVTSVAVAYPANTITLDATQAMFDEFRRTLLCNIELEACLSGRTANNNNNNNNSSSSSNNNSNMLRSYFCPFPSCGKDFRRLEHLKRHLRTHTMERPYLCNVCGKRFSRSDNLAQHKKTHER
ncbi:STE like transcription factor-domain-containing protein, partial [Phycomyces nitens]